MTVVTPRGTPQTSAPVSPTEEAPNLESALTAEPEAQVPEAKEELLSPKFAALARQQKEIRRQQIELKAREEALKAKEAEYSTAYIPKSKFKADPFSVLTEEGISYDQIVNAAMSQDPQSQKFKAIEDKLTAMQEAQAKAQEEAAANQQKAYDQAVNHVRMETKLLVDSDPEFEAIKAEGDDAVEAVVELIKLTLKDTGKLLSVKDAATRVEEHLLERAIRFAGLEKVKKKLTPQQEAAVAEAPVVPKQQSKTLTNAATVMPSKRLTEKQRVERAMMAFRGELTS